MVNFYVLEIFSLFKFLIVSVTHFILSLFSFAVGYCHFLSFVTWLFFFVVFSYCFSCFHFLHLLSLYCSIVFMLNYIFSIHRFVQCVCVWGGGGGLYPVTCSMAHYDSDDMLVSIASPQLEYMFALWWLLHHPTDLTIRTSSRSLAVGWAVAQRGLTIETEAIVANYYSSIQTWCVPSAHECIDWGTLGELPSGLTRYSPFIILAYLLKYSITYSFLVVGHSSFLIIWYEMLA